MSRRLLLPMLLLAALASMGVGEGVGQWRPPQYTTDPGSMVNVRDFGAVGDGVADDTAEITAAISEVDDGDCSSGNGGVVFVPAGTYLVSSAINVPRCVLLKGEHRSSTQIRADPGFAATTAVVTLCQEDTTQFGHGCALEGITIDANQVADWGVMTTNAQEGSWIKGFVIRNTDTYGIYMKDRAAAEPGVHRFAIEDGEIYFTTNSATDRGIRLDSNTYGPAHITITNVTVGGNATTAGTIGIELNQSEAILAGIHLEKMETGLKINAQQVLVESLHCTSTTTTCIWITTSGVGTIVEESRGDAGVTTHLQDDSSGINVTDVLIHGYFQKLNTTVQFRVPVGATSTITCAAAALGSLFYDTNAGTIGTADDGRLCVCDDNAATGYRWRPVGGTLPGDLGVPIDLTGSSTTDCGT